MPEIAEASPIGLENKPTLGQEKYRIGSDNVQLSWARFTPEGKESDNSQKAVVFLPGWPWQAKAETIWAMPRMLSQKLGLQTLAIDSRLNRITLDALSIEAEAIRQFIVKANFKEVTIFGHSEGAIRAANLAVLLEQENSGVAVNGVVLANPMGLYEQDFFRELAPNFIVDTFKVDPQEKNPRMPVTLQSQMKLLTGFASSIGRDVKNTLLVRYPWFFAQQMQAISKVNQNFSKIKAPVVIMACERDKISDYRGYLPPNEVNERMSPPTKSEGQLRSEISGSDKWEKLPEEEKARFKNKETFIEHYLNSSKIQQQMIAASKARGQLAKEKLLPQAGPMKVIVATKYSSHAGLFKRAEQTAHVVSKIFDRLRHD